MPVLRISSGEFYTSALSDVLKRTPGNGKPEEFGRIAVDTACDVISEGGDVILIDKASDDVLFTFKAELATTYEIVNTPPDSATSPPAGHHHGGGLTAAQKDHFQNYYRLFKDPKIERFVFEKKNVVATAPAPEPTRCGGTGLGKRGKPLK